jgi:hypothetical protein
MNELSALLIPRERPPDLVELKKALLTFDRVFLFEPADREVIPPATLMMAASGGMMPIGLQTHPVLPLGKAPGFEAEFESVAAAIDFGKAEGLIETIVPPPDLSGRLYIGNVPVGPDTPNSAFVLGVLRHFATDQEMLNDAVATAFPLADLDDAALEALAPNGSGHQEINTLPSPVMYGGPVPSEALREVVTRLARARLGAVVRALATAHNKKLQPIADDQGLASVIQRMSHRLETIDAALPGEEDDHRLLDRLGRLHRIVLTESFVGSSLDTIPLEDLMRLRTKAWGNSQQHRQRLLETLRHLALEEESAQAFEVRCRQELDNYRRSREQAQHDWTNLRIKVECTIGAAASGMTSGVVQKILGTGSIETLLILGTVIIPLAGEYIPAVRDRLRAEREMKSSAGYSLATPYRTLLK